MDERRVPGTRTSAVDAERSRRRELIHLTAAGSTRTYNVVLLRLDSGALERAQNQSRLLQETSIRRSIGAKRRD